MLSEDETAELNQLEDQQNRCQAAFQRHRSTVEQPSLSAAAVASDAGRSDHHGAKASWSDLLRPDLRGHHQDRVHRVRPPPAPELEQEYGITIQHVVWIEGDFAAEAAYHQQFDHLRLDFRRGHRSGGPFRELFRAGPELLAFLATVDPAAGLALAEAIRADEEQANAPRQRNHRRRPKGDGLPAPRSWSEVRKGLSRRDLGRRPEAPATR